MSCCHGFFNSFAIHFRAAITLLESKPKLIEKRSLVLEREMEKQCLLVIMMALAMNMASSEPLAPCYFIFGDSLVDSGNNNQLSSLARADYFPYGIDFPFGPTGRFSNGKTTVDVIAELLGFEDYITPYVTARGQDILRGVNYASAAAGIREETGRQLGGRITFAGQVSYHVNTVARVVNILGDESKAANYLSKCIYSIGLGSNDYLNNYFMPLYYSTGSQFSPDQYADDLISRYADQLRILYNNGARKFALVGIGAIGCSPNELAQRSQDGRTCDERINEANRMFNARLISLVDQFNQKTPDAKFTYINAYGVFQDIVNNPARYGFGVTNAGCCGVGRNNGQITCLPGQAPCLNRNEFVFWDAFHPGEAANIIIGRRSFRAESPNDAHPYDIEHLAML
ncbi:PREDICTED: GDSL esterase/lipase At5g45670-like isoform X2 [Tarenaya hassleriana]|nr:PREDICTED: GDSL esterase/lipase At5g45670-like isoform X2 [Tarenaya hassleriana]XP_010518838.1 PREDICTED: GDSL esterase/lipase At5g45670-like isoform X2 [Tarenaya hassleriana]